LTTLKSHYTNSIQRICNCCGYVRGGYHTMLYIFRNIFSHATFASQTVYASILHRLEVIYKASKMTIFKSVARTMQHIWNYGGCPWGDIAPCDTF